jgi:hypothetical protein
LKHLVHVRDLTWVPSTNVLMECESAAKHSVHVGLWRFFVWVITYAVKTHFLILDTRNASDGKRFTGLQEKMSENLFWIGAWLAEWFSFRKNCSCCRARRLCSINFLRENECHNGTAGRVAQRVKKGSSTRSSWARGVVILRLYKRRQIIWSDVFLSMLRVVI